MTPISGVYLKLGAEARILKNWCSLKTKEDFDLALCNFSPKIIMISKKKRSLLRIDLLFPYFPPKIMVISKKKGLHSESNCGLSIFVANFRCSLKKKVRTQNQASICQFLSPNLPITCAITIIFSKSSAALLGFSKFCSTKHKMSICFATPKLF